MIPKNQHLNLLNKKIKAETKKQENNKIIKTGSTGFIILLY